MYKCKTGKLLWKEVKQFHDKSCVCVAWLAVGGWGAVGKDFPEEGTSEPSISENEERTTIIISNISGQTYIESLWTFPVRKQYSWALVLWTTAQTPRFLASKTSATFNIWHPGKGKKESLWIAHKFGCVSARWQVTSLHILLGTADDSTVKVEIWGNSFRSVPKKKKLI